MRRLRTCSMFVGIAALTLLQTPTARADDNDGPVSVTVSFGAGLNTAGLPPNPANHHVLPGTIHVKAGGVVNFAVAGFHQIFVYSPGKRVRDVVLPVDPMALFINDLTGIYYQGISPAAPPPPPPAPPISNAINRIESVLFTEPGRYLVICNVTPHFRDGMWAWVVVTGGRNDHDDEHGHHGNN